MITEFCFNPIPIRGLQLARMKNFLPSWRKNLGHFIPTHPPLDLELIKLLHEMNPAIQLPHSNPSTYDNTPTLIQNIIKNKQKAFHNKVASKGIIYMLISRFLKDAQPKDSSSDNRIINVARRILEW